MSETPNAPPADENQIILERRAKLKALRAQGVAFPNHFRREHLARDLHELHGARDTQWLEDNKVPVKVAGRMMLKRVMGKASFANLQDMSGTMQLRCNPAGVIAPDIVANTTLPSSIDFFISRAASRTCRPTKAGNAVSSSSRPVSRPVIALGRTSRAALNTAVTSAAVVSSDDMGCSGGASNRDRVRWRGSTAARATGIGLRELGYGGAGLRPGEGLGAMRRNRSRCRAGGPRRASAAHRGGSGGHRPREVPAVSRENRRQGSRGTDG